MKRRFQLEFLRNRGLRPHHTFFDIGCGTLRGGVPVIRYLDRGNYVGADVRALALSEGMKELVDEGLEGSGVTLLLIPDIAELQLGRRFDYMWAFSVLFHMTDEIVEGCLDFVARHLDEGGSFYANVNIGDRSPDSWDRFPVVWRSEADYRQMAERVGLRVEDVGALSSLGHLAGDELQDRQRMFRFYRA